LPFIIAICIELFVLPIDYFTFRVWETLSVRRSFGILRGPFYPDIIIAKTEMGGDLDSQTSCAIKKDVVWITDQYGYRKANTLPKRYPVVIVGDSNLAGGGLTQDDTLASVLEKRLHQGVYPLAPESLKTIFEHGLLKQFPPDIIILESIERDILTCTLKISKDKDFGKLPFWNDILLKIQSNRLIQSIAITLDRIFKTNMLNYLRARINKTGFPDIKGSGTTQCPILFLQGAAANNDISMEKINAFAQNIKKTSDFFTSKGIRFIFLPIPNKENIHHQYLGTKKPVFLENLIKKLNELNIEVVDTQKAFDYMTAKTTSSLYQRDDTHWNAEGVKVTADLLEDLIRKKPQRRREN
jgi:alginate O-acetyltransferase complex protein AlgJ